MNQRQRITTLVTLIMVVMVATAISLVMYQPWKVDELDDTEFLRIATGGGAATYTSLVLEEVPNASYMRFMVEGGVEGEAVLTHELRTLGGAILATRAYTVAMAGIYTDTVAPSLECLAWGIVPTSTAEIWVQGRLYIEPPSGVVSVAINGIGYSDLGTPITDADVRGFYKMGTLKVYKLYFPMVINESK